MEKKGIKYVNLQSWMNPSDMDKYDQIKSHLQNNLFKEKLSDSFIVRWILKNLEKVGGIDLV